jgi:N-acetyl-anhydromuramyl-L-alanine amidase AmpD
MSVWQDLISIYRGYSAKPEQLKKASLAQWILESGRGTSELARNYLNFAGLKYRDRMAGYATPVTYTGADKVTTTYCKFGSISEFIDGYWNFITSPGAPYKDWQKYENDAQGYLEYIAKAGYCPLPGYVEQVSRAIPEAVTLLGVTAEKPPEPAPAKSSAPPPPATATPSKPAWHDELSAKFLNRRSSPIQGIVLHDTAGSGTHNDTRYLSNPQDGRKVSVDFTVEKDGSIWKLNPDLRSYYCNHAGRATEWLGFKNAQVNAVTIGIEIVQTDKLTGPPYYPAVQVQAAGALCAWLCSQYEFNNSRITTHRQIIIDGSRSDPRKFPFDDFWAAYWSALGRGQKFAASQMGEGEGDDADSPGLG